MPFPPLPLDRWPDAPLEVSGPRPAGPRPAVRAIPGVQCRGRAPRDGVPVGGRARIWFGDHDCLVFSDIPADRLLRWDAASGITSVFRQPSRFANGNTRDGARPAGHLRARQVGG